MGCKKKKKMFIDNHLFITAENASEIEGESIDHSSSRNWFSERIKHLTSSNFSAVINRRLYIQSRWCKWGINNKPFTLKFCEERTNPKL